MQCQEVARSSLWTITSLNSSHVEPRQQQQTGRCVLLLISTRLYRQPTCNLLLRGVKEQEAQGKSPYGRKQKLGAHTQTALLLKRWALCRRCHRNNSPGGPSSAAH